MAIGRGTLGGLFGNSASNISSTINSSPWTALSANTFSYSTSWTNWTYTTREELDESQVKALKHILTLASADDDELRDIASSIVAASEGDTTFDETLKVLKMLKHLVTMGQLLEKLAR